MTIRKTYDLPSPSRYSHTTTGTNHEYLPLPPM